MATFTFPVGSQYRQIAGGASSGLVFNQNSPASDARQRLAGAQEALRGWPSTAAGGAVAADTALLAGITADIGSNKALAAQNEANARAKATEAEGYQREIEAYATVGAIAEQGFTVEGIAGNIRQLQAGRAVQRTIGKQRAETASAGFADAGSSLDLLRSTLQEGYLTDQLIRSGTSLAQGGYLEQRAAAEADAAGARLASDAALELSRSYTAAGELATANAANQTKALQDYLTATGGITDPTRALVTSTLEQDPNQPTTIDPYDLAARAERGPLNSNPGNIFRLG
jgi:hypothetical protein